MRDQTCTIDGCEIPNSNNGNSNNTNTPGTSNTNTNPGYLVAVFEQENCSACDQAKPFITSIESKLPNNVSFQRIDAPSRQDLITKYSLRITPTLLVLNGSTVLARYEAQQIEQAEVSGDIYQYFEQDNDIIPGNSKKSNVGIIAAIAIIAFFIFKK